MEYGPQFCCEHDRESPNGMCRCPLNCACRDNICKIEVSFECLHKNEPLSEGGGCPCVEDCGCRKNVCSDITCSRYHCKPDCYCHALRIGVKTKIEQKEEVQQTEVSLMPERQTIDRWLTWIILNANRLTSTQIESVSYIWSIFCSRFSNANYSWILPTLLIHSRSLSFKFIWMKNNSSIYALEVLRDGSINHIVNNIETKQANDISYIEKQESVNSFFVKLQSIEDKTPT